MCGSETDVILVCAHIIFTPDKNCGFTLSRPAYNLGHHNKLVRKANCFKPGRWLEVEERLLLSLSSFPPSLRPTPSPSSSPVSPPLSTTHPPYQEAEEGSPNHPPSSPLSPSSSPPSPPPPPRRPSGPWRGPPWSSLGRCHRPPSSPSRHLSAPLTQSWDLWCCARDRHSTGGEHLEGEEPRIQALYNIGLCRVAPNAGKPTLCTKTVDSLDMEVPPIVFSLRGGQRRTGEAQLSSTHCILSQQCNAWTHSRYS